MILKTLFKIWLCLVLVAWTWNTIKAHPDSTSPYWYPSSYIYGFVTGCWQTAEQTQMISKDMWPDDIKSICGCVIDALRHTIPYHEVENKDPVSIKKFDDITRGVLPACISEQDKLIIQRNKQH